MVKMKQAETDWLHVKRGVRYSFMFFPYSFSPTAEYKYRGTLDWNKLNLDLKTEETTTITCAMLLTL